MTHEEIDILWHKAMHDSVQNDEMFTRYRFAALVAKAEREVCCAIVTGLCLSDNNAHEINTEIRVRGEKEGGGDASKVFILGERDAC